ncbi:MAG: tRNA-dihydrouridine synthase [Actinobacteria bacterium]|nr:tRNA-dihydrouridine synthase [Actinomycetota bacterium]
MSDFNLADLIPELVKMKAGYLKECLCRIPFLKVTAVESPIHHSFKIGNVLIKNPLVSAPLAGISDNTYRIIARAFGAALTFSEMITSYGIYFKHKNSLDLAEITDYEKPCAIQIFGSDPIIISEAAKIIEPKADIIDINMGCPVAKVLKSKSGGFLLQDEEKIKSIISKITRAVKKPVTIKVRIGWDKNNINVCKIAEIAESNGISAITIHGRTVRQGFSGEVNYDVIRQVKEKVKIPVIVSGDIDSPEKAIRVLNYTKCDALMLGRASKGSMWIFLDTLVSLLLNLNRDFQIVKNGIGSKYVGTHEFLNQSLDRLKLKSNDYCPDINWKQNFAILYLKFLIYFKDEAKAVKEFRKYLIWIFKGTRGISKIKSDFFKISNFNDVKHIISTLNNISS